MNDFKFLILCNILIDATVVMCVTYIAREFQNSNLLWWYLLIALTGYTRARTYNDNK